MADILYLSSRVISQLATDGAGGHHGAQLDLVANMTTELASLVSRLEQAVIRLEKAGGPGTANRVAQGSAPSSSQDCNNVESAPAIGPWGEESSTPYIVAWDDMMNGPFKNFMDKSKLIGGEVETIAKLVQGCFLTQRAYLICATKSNKPNEADLPKILEPTGKKIQAVVEFRESNRSSRYFNHLSAVSEAIPALSWVTVEPAPSPFVKEMGDAGIFYTNRILKEYKDKDKSHVSWTQDWIGIFKEMQSYVKQYHTTGVAWNPKGGRALDNMKGAPPAPAGGPPPPPPGCPRPAISKKPTVDTSALFSDLNKGASVTSGLKKVTSDMQTHKNPSLREGPKPSVKQSSPAVPTRSSPVKQTAPVKPPRFELEGRKWFVEYQKNNRNIIIDDTSMDQTVYIFKCEGTVVQVKGKLNSIILDSCKKTSLVFDNLVSALEIVNCQSAEVQVTGRLPSCSIEKTDGCQLYLSKDSVGLEVVTSKSTTMNLLIPKDDGQFEELPIPEQFKTQIKGGKLETLATEIAG
ncbi:unnamed protein product, partial [Meganyctiphanes norvegica]